MRSFLLVKLTTLVAACALALSVISLWVHGDAKGGFAFLFPVIALSWILWIVCLFGARDSIRIGRLVLLWCLIDAIPLTLFISFAADVPNWATSHGVDAVVLLAYFPVIIPTIFSLALLPVDLAPHAGSSVAGAFFLWATVSLVAAVQSGLIAAILGAIRRLRANQSRAAV